jgi:tripartite ATP-independent transporter DctP family solute receptor
MNRKFKVLASIAFLVALLVAFGMGNSASAAGKTVEMTVASTAMTDLSWYRTAVQWKDALEKTGLFKVNLKFGGILGGEREGAEAVQMGTIEAVWVSDVGLSAVVPEIAYTNLPYLFSSYAQVDKNYMNGFIGEDVKAKLEAKGFKFLGFCENDFRGLTNSKRAISKPDDLKGMKIRVPEVPVYIELFKKLGTQPTPMAVTELATALQQKTVDGQDNGVLLTKANGYYQLQKYMTLTNHIYNAGAILCNPNFFNSLDKEHQDVLVKLSKKYSKVQIDMNRADVKKFLKEIEAFGVKVTKLSPEQMKSFVEIGHSCWGEAEKKFGKEWIDRLKKIK